MTLVEGQCPQIARVIGFGTYPALEVNPTVGLMPTIAFLSAGLITSSD